MGVGFAWSGGGSASGSAGGVLSGTFPNPGFASDMATQAELDAGVAVKRFSDDFSTDRLATDYTYLTNPGNLTVAGGVATPASGGMSVSVNAFSDTGDVRAQVKIGTGATYAGTQGFIARYWDTSNFLLVAIGGAQLALYRNVGGSFTTISNVAFNPANSTSYWLVAVFHGNSVRGDVYTSAPAVGVDPTVRVESTLSGTDASRFGAGRRGQVGVRAVNGNGNQTLDDLSLTAL